MFSGIHFLVGKWSDYNYCKECSRPLRDFECRVVSSTSGEGRTTFYCQRCNRVVRPICCFFGYEAFSLIGFSVTVLMLGLVIFAAVHMSINGKEITQSDRREILVAMLLGLPWIGVGCLYRLTCKPIYDRWVMQHGTDPDKWPELTKPD